MTELNTWLVFLHVLGAMVWVGAWAATRRWLTMALAVTAILVAATADMMFA
ncbi:hypothetical protein OIE66_12600 [Nonomuraea sp. NBC_01738]|uniref:hypothetical protein n=1 Tax=Nonomuraea sp. NBC_01738 TaxID=2976003 RepID=UPI002E0EC9EA|nr:hypothetical protein OIE66_12600 [Nonomuraea sp. NBC_01738]